MAKAIWIRRVVSDFTKLREPLDSIHQEFDNVYCFIHSHYIYKYTFYLKVFYDRSHLDVVS